MEEERRTRKMSVSRENINETHIQSMLNGDSNDYRDIINSRYGWAVAEQFVECVGAHAYLPLEKANSNALRHIADFLKKRKEILVYNELARYLEDTKYQVIEEQEGEEK